MKYLIAREQESEDRIARLSSLETSASRAQGRGVNNISLWDDDPNDFSYFDPAASASAPSASPIVNRTAPYEPPEDVAPSTSTIPESSPSKTDSSRRQLMVETEHDKYVKAVGPSPKELGKVDLVKLWDVSMVIFDSRTSTHCTLSVRLKRAHSRYCTHSQWMCCQLRLPRFRPNEYFRQANSLALEHGTKSAPLL